ncbi:MAG: hypothetical protein Q7U45_09340, partial [Burkholderiaceae bacterium]|nr:hypothetical protein [Burkholderiaceae bacterium]
SHLLLWRVYQTVTGKSKPDRAEWPALSQLLQSDKFGVHYQQALRALGERVTASMDGEQRADALVLAQLMRSDGFARAWVQTT